MKYLVLAFTLAVSGLMWNSAKAEKALNIIVVDLDRVVSQSKAGKSMTKQLEKQLGDWEKKTAALDAELEADVEKWREEGPLMSPDVRQSKFEELQQKELSKRQELRVGRDAITRGGQKAAQEILTVVNREVKVLAEKHKADLVANRGALVYSTPGLDVTHELIIALNKKLTKVRVTPVKAEKN